jgi:hypothetical protein
MKNFQLDHKRIVQNNNQTLNNHKIIVDKWRELIKYILFQLLISYKDMIVQNKLNIYTNQNWNKMTTSHA